MQTNAQTPQGRDPSSNLKAGHLKTRAKLAKPAGKPEDFSSKLASDRTFVAEPTD